MYHEKESGAGVFPGAIPAERQLRMRVFVTVNPGTPAGNLRAGFKVEGGGAPLQTTSVTNAVNAPEPEFGFSNYAFTDLGSDGRPDTQAGDHPNEVRTLIQLNNAFHQFSTEGEELPYATSPENPKDIVVDLPVGLVGSILAAPQCPLSALSSSRNCPADTIVGEIVTRPGAFDAIDSPLYNMEPERGYPAEFGFHDGIFGAHTLAASVVPTPEGYRLQVTSRDISEISITQIETVFYGDPVKKQEERAAETGRTPTPLPQVPFFTNPTSCSVPLTSTVYMDSWHNPGSFNAGWDPGSRGRKLDNR